jgi:hypothetical protein
MNIISKVLKGQRGGVMAKKIIFIIYMIGVFASICEASITGKLEGTVTDKSGNPLEKVKISIISVKVTSRKFNIQTKKDGKFVQIGIIPGYYQISFSKSRFAPITKEIKRPSSIFSGPLGSRMIMLRPTIKSAQSILAKATQTLSFTVH